MSAGSSSQRVPLPNCMVILLPPMQEEVDEERRREGRTSERVVTVNGANGTNGAGSNGASRVPDTLYSPFSPYRVRVDLPDVLSKELRDL